MMNSLQITNPLQVLISRRNHNKSASNIITYRTPKMSTSKISFNNFNALQKLRIFKNTMLKNISAKSWLFDTPRRCNKLYPPINANFRDRSATLHIGKRKQYLHFGKSMAFIPRLSEIKGIRVNMLRPRKPLHASTSQPATPKRYNLEDACA